MRANRLFLSVTLAFFLLLNSCRLLVGQNPRDSFASKKLPRALELIANQKREFTPELNKRIADRLAKENPADLIPVGVIDSGLDLTHPDLIDQLAYKMKDGKVIAVGRDIMGADSMPSYMMVDPTLFSYGAEAVKNGLIYGEKASPLQYMKQVNERFTQLLLQGIAESPALSSSYFSKVTSGTFTVFGFETWLQEQEEFARLEQYRKSLAENKVLTATTPDPKKIFSEQSLKALQEPWEFVKSENLPSNVDSAFLLEHFDLFYELVKSSLERVDSEFKIKKNRQQLKEFLKYHSSSTKPDPIKITQDSLSRSADAILKNAGAFIMLGYDAFDPLYDLKQLVSKMSQHPELPLDQQLFLAKQKIKEGLENIETLPKVSEPQKLKVAKAKGALDSLNAVLDYLYKYETDPAERAAYDSQKRRWIVRTMHPYIDSASLSNSHHTHVASTIARQHKNIRIYPIKATTQSVASPEQYRELAAGLETEFKTWLKEPLIQDLVQQIGKEYKQNNITESRLLKEMRAYAEANPLNLIFIDEVFKGIQEAGNAKLLLTNVSLGTMFKKNHDSKQKWAAIASDIYSEFVRYKMGQTIRDHAPGTLFMVANGNDGAWVDGVSKSAFPVGITSERLIKIAAQKGVADAPNNVVKNVMGVGSVNPNEKTLTSFSNFLLDSRIPQIFSTGEEIMAAVPPRQSSWHQAQVDAALKENFAPLKDLSSVEIDLIRDLNNPKSMAAYEFLKKLNTGLTSATTALAQSLAITNPVSRNKMSGTSMATPTATGIIAVFLAKKREALGMSHVLFEELYNHEEFKPEKIIADVFKIAQAKSLSGSISLHLLIEGIRTWKPDTDESKIKKALKALTFTSKKKTNSAKACLGFYN
ncbi:MAG: S8 family serine peptidase [Bdellovibrionaceae bacterium]|nr:S8 family serine peptidase [Pseudobdellovibrionaceae bacterium]